MFGYRSSICLGLGSNLQIDSCEWVLAAWSVFSLLFSLFREEQQIISRKHTQFCFFVIAHNTLLAMEISGSLQGPGYQVLLFHLLMQTAAEQKRMLRGGGTLKKKKKAARLFLPLSQTSNIIHDDSRRPCMTLMERNPAACVDIHVHVWEFPHEILQGCGTLWTASPW